MADPTDSATDRIAACRAALATADRRATESARSNGLGTLCPASGNLHPHSFAQPMQIFPLPKENRNQTILGLLYC